MLWLFCTVLLMLFNKAADAKPQNGNDETKTIGLFEIPTSANAKAGVVNLASLSRLIKTPDEFNKLNIDEILASREIQIQTKPCKVLNADGDIEVIYDALAENEGCSMDLVVNEGAGDKTNFIAKVSEENKKCISPGYTLDEIVEASNKNLFPFIIGKDNAYLETHAKGPEYGDTTDCAEKTKCNKDYQGKCMKSTVLEIGWSRLEGGSVYGHLHQVGEPVASWYIPITEKDANEWRMDVKMTSGQDKNINIEISDKSGMQKDFPGGGDQEQPVCNKPKDATKGPIIWQVSEESETYKGERILFFHFFPQKATRRHGKVQNWWTEGTPPQGGPKCKGSLSFIFPKDYVKGILVVEPLLTPISNNNTDNNTDGASTPMTMGPMTITEQPTGSNETEASPNATDSTTVPTETGSTGAPAGLSLGLIIGIVVGAVVGVIVVAILVYFCCCRDKKEDDKDEDAESRAVVVRAADKDEDEKKEESSAAATAWETNSVKGKEEEINSVKATDEEFNQAWNKEEGEINSLRGTEEEFDQAWNKKEGDNSVNKNEGDNSVNKKEGKSYRPLMSEEEAQYNSSLKGSLRDTY